MTTINILLIEDSPDDAELVLQQLAKGGLKVSHKRVCEEKPLREAIISGKWDIVISDFTMPQLNGMTAFSIVRELNKDVPFIIVSGALGEDTAVRAMRMGVQDYLLKDKLGRLVEVVKRELEQAKNREKLKEKEQQFLQAQKMEVVGKLAGGIAHDFNNILAVILLYCDSVLERVPHDEITFKDVNQIKTAGEKAAGLTRQLLAFSKQQTLKPRIVSINPIILNLQSMLTRILGESIVFKSELSPQMVPTKIDPGHFEQVVMNLVINARDAMPSGGNLTLQTKVVEIPVGETIPQGTYARLSVIDSGVGIEKTNLSKIFEPFFTTKGHRGTGLGLSTVQGIILQSGGHITVDSLPGKGTTFHIYLPLCDLKELQTANFEAEAKQQKNLKGTRILLLEDEPLLSQIIRSVLEKEGCEICSATTEAEAISQLEDKSRPIDLVLSDVLMPEINGIQLMRKVIGRFPGLKIVLMSGHLDFEDKESKDVVEETLFLQKPFNSEQLKLKVAEALKR
jgi:two-component system cell cycle sensor histidine kinase/response regulator CckA